MPTLVTGLLGSSFWLASGSTEYVLVVRNALIRNSDASKHRPDGSRFGETGPIPS